MAAQDRSLITGRLNTASQPPEWIDGAPRAVGFSENVTARHPAAESLRISSAPIRIEQRKHTARDQAIWIGAGPLLYVPIIVGANHRHIHCPIGAGAEHGCGKPRENSESSDLRADLQQTCHGPSRAHQSTRFASRRTEMAQH